MKPSDRVVFNTTVQYLRTGLSLLISLYTTRLILDALGIENYGIYSLVGGIVSMLSFLQSSLAGTTQRFLSFHQGEDNMVLQKKIFNNSVITQLFISSILIIILVALTPFLFGGFLNIPAERTEAAIWVYYCMLGSLFFTMQATPYVATLIAHENIFFATVIQLTETFLKIPVALSLMWFQVDSLKLYGVLLVGVQILSFSLYFLYSRKKYNETKEFSFSAFDIKIFKQMFSFAGWVMYSSGCIAGRTQGIALVLNKFFGTALNAAYGLAFTVSSQLSFLSSSIGNAINPQIIKAEGAGDRKRMLRLAEISSKFSFLMLALVSIPAILEMNSLLSIWLKVVPEYAVLFSQLVVLANLLDQLTTGLVTANKAIGDIKYYSLIVNTTKLLTLPVSILGLYLGLPVYTVMIFFVLFEFICAMIRLPFLKNTGGMSILGFSKRVFRKLIIPFTSTLIMVLIYMHFVSFKWSFIGTFFISLIILPLSAYFFGLCDDEKVIIDTLLAKITLKIKSL